MDYDNLGWRGVVDVHKGSFIMPVRRNVTGTDATSSSVEAWNPHGEGPDEVCDAKLLLHDRRKGEQPLLTRVVGRKRHRTGKVAWYATNLTEDGFSASDIVRLYFERWPAQEHVYRDGNGSVGLGTHHGYGERNVDNVAVIDRMEKLAGEERALCAKVAEQRVESEQLTADRDNHQRALTIGGPQIEQMRKEFDEAMASGKSVQLLRERHQNLRLWEQWLVDLRMKVDGFVQQVNRIDRSISTAEAARTAKRAESELLAKRRRIFTIDVELDDIPTGAKLTFMNLCKVLMKDYLGIQLELDTLIEAVLNLPGEHVCTPTTEAIRIYRQARDKRVMEAAERACAM